MSTFPKMHTVLTPSVCGTAEIIHYEVTKSESEWSAIRGDYASQGTYAVLRVNGRTLMSDTNIERRSNYEVVRRSHGKVLVAGLGIGMILHPILRKPEVESVIVIEKNRDVISLVGKSVTHSKLSIVNADIFEWRPNKGQKFNTIYFDIWPDRCTDYLAEMAKLHQKFKVFKDRDDDSAWMESWSRQELKLRQRRELQTLWYRYG
jgi:spermidine synthase